MAPDSISIFLKLLLLLLLLIRIWFLKTIVVVVVANYILIFKNCCCCDRRSPTLTQWRSGQRRWSSRGRASAPSRPSSPRSSGLRSRTRPSTRQIGRDSDRRTRPWRRSRSTNFPSIRIGSGRDRIWRSDPFSEKDNSERFATILQSCIVYSETRL